MTEQDAQRCTGRLTMPGNWPGLQGVKTTTMRTIKLQMQISLDGYVCGPNGEMDWMSWDWGDDIKRYVQELTAPADTILLGRKLAEGFIPHWKANVDNPATADDFGRKMTETPKIVFSRSLPASPWDNVTLAGEDLPGTIARLKQLPGGDVLVYGGASLAAALIGEGLIDEYHLFVNPTAIGQGKSIFGQLKGNRKLSLAGSQSFANGITVLFYLSKPENQ